MTLDQTMYLVINEHKDGPIIWEIQLARMGLSTVAKDLRDGQYQSPVLAVIEINPSLHICRDVTHEFDPLLK